MKEINKRMAIAPEEFDFSIDNLGECNVKSPVKYQPFVEDSERVLFHSRTKDTEGLKAKGKELPTFEKGGPREKIYHDPAWTRVAIVTCGGLCPGLNDVIKGLVKTLYFDYGVKNVFGIQYGYRGLIPKYGLEPIILTPDKVDTIHEAGGTILGSSRGKQPVNEIVDSLQRLNINVLFCVGGDGTLSGAGVIADEIATRKQAISVIGVPKTIDNDLSFIDRTFGFETAVYASSPVISCAHAEAKGAYHGVGLVKLMGRDSGFVAACASVANSVVNFCLIPESEFEMDGEEGLLRAMERRFKRGKSHSVIVVAEGAGQHFFKDAPVRKDQSGNILKNDIGLYLKERINSYFKEKGEIVQVKYFDPSYQLRSVPAQGTDAIFCYLLAAQAVHAAMAGKTNMVSGYWNNNFTNVPIKLAILERRKVDTESELWHAVLGATRQMDYFIAD